MLGAKSSQDNFDAAMFRIFGDTPHCLNQRDDILMGGRDETEHKEVLKTVLQRARDYGITFNRETCQFGKERIEFFGHIFTKGGLRPLPDKVRAIKECGVPESKEATWQATWTASSRTTQSSSTTVPANQKRNENALFKTRRISIQEDSRQHLK